MKPHAPMKQVLISVQGSQVGTVRNRAPIESNAIPLRALLSQSLVNISSVHGVKRG
jgi:hypothetical protein